MPSTTTMTVRLNAALSDFVSERVQREGVFENVSDYVRDLIRRDQHRSEEDERWLQELDASIERSFEDLRAGRLQEAGVVFDRLETKYKRMAAERADR